MIMLLEVKSSRSIQIPINKIKRNFKNDLSMKIYRNPKDGRKIIDIHAKKMLKNVVEPRMFRPDHI
jgi:hypothetical protein